MRPKRAGGDPCQPEDCFAEWPEDEFESCTSPECPQCPRSPVVRNALATECKNNEPDDTCHVNCKKGYNQSGVTLVCDGETLQWKGPKACDGNTLYIIHDVTIHNVSYVLIPVNMFDHVQI